MLSIIHCQEKLINSTLMKTWAIFYFATEKSRISICCLVMCWFSPLGCLTDVHHICRYLKYLLSSTTFALSKHHKVGGTFLMMTAMKIKKKKSQTFPHLTVLSTLWHTQCMATYISKQQMYINIDKHIFDAFHKHPKFTALPKTLGSY